MTAERATGVDIGGTAIKIGRVVLDNAEATIVSRADTPRPATPEAVFDTIATVLGAGDETEPLGVAVCGSVRDGMVSDANNLHPSWQGFDLRAELAARGHPASVVMNDADAAAHSEAEVLGDVERALFVTFGTGVGTSLVDHGRVVAGLELGEARIDDTTVDDYASTRHAERHGWHEWGRRAGRAIDTLTSLTRPDMVVVGGGAAERWAEWSAELGTGVELRPARLGNRAGVVGVALAALHQQP